MCVPERVERYHGRYSELLGGLEECGPMPLVFIQTPLLLDYYFLYWARAHSRIVARLISLHSYTLLPVFLSASTIYRGFFVLLAQDVKN